MSSRPSKASFKKVSTVETLDELDVVTPTANDISPKKDDKKEEEEVPDHGGLKRLKSEYGQEYQKFAFVGLLGSIGAGGVMPIFAVIFAELLDILEDTTDDDGNTNFSSDSRGALFMFVGMGVGALVFNVIQYYFWGIYGSKLTLAVRQAYFEALTRQEIGFHEVETSAKLNARLTTECFAVQEAVGTKYGFYIQTWAQVVIGMILAFVYSWRLSLVMFATMPALLLVGMVQGHLMQGTGGGQADPFVHAGAFSQEVLTNIRTVLAFPTLIESKWKEYCEHVDLALPFATKKLVYIGIGLGGFMGCLFAVCYSVGMFTGAVFLDEGHITVSELFGSYFAFMMGGMGLGQLGSIVGDLKNGEVGANKFYEVLERTPKMTRPDTKEPVVLDAKDKLDGSIELQAVRFAYPAAPEHEVLRGVDVSIESGKTLAIVGPSGSGKSTIIGLLERYYDPKAGIIRVGNEPIHNYDVESFRSHIGLVSQMPLLFDTSINENIRAGRDVSQQEIVRAAKLANAHEFISALPQQYETQVGELGGRLSGGQRQRICIARAIVRVPSILLLDEATSALDTKSEREVQDALDKISKELNLTTVVIAHRLSTIKDADKIMVLVDGVVEEVGDHRELIDKNGVYAALVASQSLIEVSKEQHQQHKQEYVERRDSSTNFTETTTQSG